MSREHKGKTSFLLCILIFLAICTFHAGDSTTIPQGKVSPFNRWQSKHDTENIGDSYSRVRGAPLHKSDHIQFTRDIEAKVKEVANSLVEDVMDFPQAWTFGNVSRPAHKRLMDPYIDDGYQADPPGVKAGRVLGPSFESHTLVPEWLAMRPLVECNDNIMTLTATGRGCAYLLVQREDGTPISPFQLPSDCGYSVRTSRRDLVMTAPYDGCYITQENGSYVLPMLWLGSSLKLSCPASPPSPLVLCSPYGMVVHLYGEEGGCSAAWVKVNDEWDPFASTACAYLIDSQPGQCLFYIPLSAPCVTVGDGVHLKLLLNRQEFNLSCPVYPHLFPQFPSPPYSQPPFPGDPEYPYSPDPKTTEAPSEPPPPQPPTQQLYVHYQLSTTHLPRPTPGSPPGPQSSQPQHPLWPGQFPYSPGINPNSPSQPFIPVLPSTTQPPKLPMGQYSPPPHYYPSPTTREPHFQGPLPLPPTSAPQFPRQPLGPQYPQHPVGPFYPPGYYNPFYPMHYPQPQIPPTPPPEEPHVPPYSSGEYYPPSSFDPYYPYGHIYVPMPPPAKGPPHVSQEQPSGPIDTAVPVVQPTQPYARPICPPNAHGFCSYYPYHAFYPPQYAVPQHPYPTTAIPPAIPETEASATPVTESPTTPETESLTISVTESPAIPETESTTIPTFPPTTVTQPPQLSPSLQCLAGRMRVSLPSADPDSIRVQVKTWQPHWSVLPHCKYMLEYTQGLGVTLHSPHPACPIQPPPAPGKMFPSSLPNASVMTSTILFVSFWDLALAKNRTLEVQCPSPYQPPTESPVSPTSLPSQPSSTLNPSTPSIIPRPKVYCSAHRMTVELPPGLIAGIVVKDDKGNQMKLQDAPKHCGYSASKEKDGRIILKLPLNSDCHMSLQGKEHLINVVYTTLLGRREARLSCPVSIPVSHTECNLPIDQRLPCGSISSSQKQCLSVGCCFSKSPPACYYPMDECTMDRHFVFSVPSSLNERLLSPASLFAAGNSSCTPVKVTRDYALFKIPMDGCGAVRLEVGKTVIYMVEITSVIHAITLNYGTITRDTPVRLLVECRYLPGTVVSVGYMVKSPTLGSPIQSQGIFGVQLRIAKDSHYKSYYPDLHRPLQKLLREPLYLELRMLNPPDPRLVLLVHYCVAYPHSGNAAWVILYNGCPNPLDPAPQQAVLPPPSPPSPQKQIRRFTISTFQFLNSGKTAEQEEIYFMCSTEVCSPLDGPCVEGCFGQ